MALGSDSYLTSQLPNRRAVSRIALIGNHTPRRCGIATFTADVAAAVKLAGIEVDVIAMNDGAKSYRYPKAVKFEIEQDCRESYLNAAEYVNSQKPDVVCVQHEYGIYGGKAGEYLLSLARELKPPLVTTLHTILREPNADQRLVLEELIQLSERVVTMTHRGKSLLQEVHRISAEKICVVPHGIPTFERHPADNHLSSLGLAGKTVVLTFGLISPDKGIEYMIRAMPRIVERHPETVYLIVGATHPQVRASRGEAYRNELVSLAADLGVGANVKFVDKFVSSTELLEYLNAAAIYVTPYLKPEQITSGTLAYAFGSGKAVVSTPYWHAEELLADGKGILVPFRNSDALATSVLELLDNPDKLRAMQDRAHECGIEMTWPTVGRAYAEVFAEASATSHEMPLRGPIPIVVEKTPQHTIPKLDLTHLMAMSDDTGLLQHAKYSTPNRHEGYCTDDNARAAILAVKLDNGGRFEHFVETAGARYVAFLYHALNEELGRFRNFMGYDRQWLESVGSEDSHGRAVWALGHIAGRSPRRRWRAIAAESLVPALSTVSSFSSPRAWAFVLLGLNELAGSADGIALAETSRGLQADLSGRLLDLLTKTRRSEWVWFEDYLTYDNARLAEALMVTGVSIGDSEMVHEASIALAWLAAVHIDSEGRFAPIGSEGFHRRGGPRAIYDQQPVEAAAMIDACAAAMRITGDQRWEREAWRAFAWFLGANSLNVSLVDERRGSCFDGLRPIGANQNQGAESTLAYLASVEAMERAFGVVDPPVRRFVL